MFLVAFLLLAPADDLSADDGEAAAVVLARWEAANRGVTSVRATYRGRLFDHAFRTVTLTEGTFHHDPAAGTLIISRPVPAPAYEIYQSRGIDHRPGAPAFSRRWYWDGEDGSLLTIDDDRREAVRWPHAPLSPEIVLQFAPGRPFAAEARDWSFAAVRRTPDDVFLSARPLTAERAANYSRALLRFRRSDWTLRGVKLYSPGGESETVYLFEDVTKNPGPPPRPALEGYATVAPFMPPPADWQAVTPPARSDESAAPSSGAGWLPWLAALRIQFGLP